MSGFYLGGKEWCIGQQVRFQYGQFNIGGRIVGMNIEGTHLRVEVLSNPNSPFDVHPANIVESESMNRVQPAPGEGTGPAIWDLVLTDIAERRKMGEQKYGRVLRADNGHDHLLDAYQECLDLVVYLRTEIEQRRIGASRLIDSDCCYVLAWLNESLSRWEWEYDCGLSDLAEIQRDMKAHLDRGVDPKRMKILKIAVETVE